MAWRGQREEVKRKGEMPEMEQKWRRNEKGREKRGNEVKFGRGKLKERKQKVGWGGGGRGCTNG